MTETEPSGGGLPGVLDSHPVAPPASESPAATPAPGSGEATGGAVETSAPSTPAGEAPAGQEGNPESATGASVDGDGNPTPAAEPFTFGKESFKTREAAEHAYLTAKGRANAAKDRTEAIASNARAWMEYAKAMEAEAASLRAGRSPNAATPATPETPTETAPDPKDWLSKVDLKFYRDLAATDPEAALLFALEQADARTEQRIKEFHEKNLKPIQDREQALEQYNAATQQAVTVWQSVGTRMDAAGKPLYPEALNKDPAAVEELTEIWMSLPYEFRMTEPGVKAAVLEYRDRQGLPPRNADAGASASASSTVLAAHQARAEAANALDGGSGTPRTVPDTPQGREANFRKAILDAGPVLRTEDGRSLGFTR